MFKYYKQSKLSSRLIAVALALLLGAVIAWQFNYDVFITLGFVAGAAFIGESFFFHRRLLTVSIITLAQLGVVGAASLIVYTIISSYYDEVAGFVISAGMESVGLAGILVTLIGNYVFSQGRLWINTLISYLIYDAILVVLIINFPNISYVVSSLIALLGILIYVTLRHFLPKDKKIDFDIKDIKSQKSAGAAQAVIQKKYPNLKIKNYDSRILLASNDKVILAILPITPSKYFTILKDEAWLDSTPITGVFEYLLEESAKASRDMQVNKKFFIPVFYVTTKNDLKSKLVALRVRNRRTPDKVMGTVFISTPDGFEQLMKGYEKLPVMNEKLIEKFDNIDS